MGPSLQPPSLSSSLRATGLHKQHRCVSAWETWVCRASPAPYTMSVSNTLAMSNMQSYVSI